jgi:DNA modification methylase
MKDEDRSTKALRVELPIDPEYSGMIPDMDRGELRQLEENILTHGCLDPIIVDARTGVIVDGHHRYHVCMKHNIPFDVVPKEFGSRDDTKIFIITNQLGRRNLSEYNRASLALKLEPLIAEKNRLRIIGGQATDKHTTTRDELAQIAGVSHDTIEKVKVIEREGATEIIRALGAEQMSIRTASVLVKLPKDVQERLPKEPKKELLYYAKRVRAQENGEKKKAREDKRIGQRQTAKLKAVVTKADAVEWLSTLEDGSVDLLFTDPPFMTDTGDINVFVKSWLALALRKVKPTGRAYIFIGAYPEELHAYLGALLKQTTFNVQVLGWSYDNTLGPDTIKDYKSNWMAVLYLWGKEAPDLESPDLVEKLAMKRITAPDARNAKKYHSWEKPYDLAEMYVRHSTKEGDLVIDPFAGSGTFLLAAADRGRIARGCDNDLESLAACKKRGAKVLLKPQK